MLLDDTVRSLANELLDLRGIPIFLWPWKVSSDYSHRHHA